MGNFKDADVIRKQNEGGYAFASPNMAETYQGVDRIANPHAEIWTTIDQIKKDNPTITVRQMNSVLASNKGVQAYIINFYINNYFNPLKLAQIVDQNIVNNAYDASVNMGVITAGKFMQISANEVILDLQLKTTPLIVDGVIGLKSVTLINSLEAELVYNALNDIRRKKYNQIVVSNPGKRQFLKTWLARLVPYNHNLVI